MSNIRDYINLTHDDFRAMSKREFETYAQVEYANYINNIAHNEDYIEYGEYFHELEWVHGRQNKDRIFN